MDVLDQLCVLVLVTFLICCDQIPIKKQHKGGSVCFGLQWRENLPSGQPGDRILRGLVSPNKRGFVAFGLAPLLASLLAQAILTPHPPASACQGPRFRSLFLLDFYLKSLHFARKVGRKIQFCSLVGKVRNAVRSAGPAEPLKAAYICREELPSKKSPLCPLRVISGMTVAGSGGPCFKQRAVSSVLLCEARFKFFRHFRS